MWNTSDSQGVFPLAVLTHSLPVVTRLIQLLYVLNSIKFSMILSKNNKKQQYHHQNGQQQTRTVTAATMLPPPVNPFTTPPRLDCLFSTTMGTTDPWDK